MTVIESDIESYLRRRVTEAGGRCFKFVTPGMTGTPDRILIFSGGRIIFVETKRPSGGRFSGMQNWWQDILTGYGCHYARVKNRAEIDKLLEGVT